MKFTVHLPTEQYGFCEAEFEADDLNVAAHNYRQLADVFKVKSGLDSKLFDAFIDKQISGGTNHIEEYNAMSPDQQAVVQLLKRSMKRINYKLTNSKE